MKIVKTFQYCTVVIEDRGHLDDPKLLAALNDMGSKGWKRSEEHEKGSNKLAILFEREVQLDTPVWIGKDPGSERDADNTTIVGAGGGDPAQPAAV